MALQAFGVPKDLRGKAQVTGKGTSTIVVTSATERLEAIGSLQAAGFRITHEVGGRVQLTRPKRFGPREFCVLIFMSVFFVIPGLCYLVLWSSMPTPVVTVVGPS